MFKLAGRVWGREQGVMGDWGLGIDDDDRVIMVTVVVMAMIKRRYD